VTFRRLRSGRGEFTPLKPRERAFSPLEGPGEPSREEPTSIPEELDESSMALAAQTQDEGYEDGYREGAEQAREELARTMEVAADLVKELQATRARLFDASRNDLIDLLAACLEWLHMATLESDRELIVRVVDAVLEDFQGDEQIALHLNGRDHDAIATELSKGQKPWTTWDLTIVPDEAVEVGGCLVKAPEGKVDATVSERLARLRAELDLLRGPASDEFGGAP